MEEMGNACKVFVGKPEEKRRFVHVGVDWKITLRWILKK
jgi:hypothetical protein